MNPIRRMRTELAARFPDLSIGLDEPEVGGGFWCLEVRRGDDYLMSIEWRERTGFGFSTPRPNDLWSAQDEHLADYDEALARVAQLIGSGGETVPPLAVRLAELRQIRGLSQAELAERAGLAQANLSRFENQEDAKISTLQKIVAALGASLSITARFPDGSSWELRI